MADNDLIGGVNVADDELTTLNGVVQTAPFPKAQRIKLIEGSDGQGNDVHDGNPLPTTDAAFGTDGATPPSIPGTGVRGWLRAIYDHLAASAAVDLTPLGTTADGPTADTVIGRLKAIANAVSTSAASWLSVRLTDGTSYLQSTAGRLQVADGGIALATSPNRAGDTVTALTDNRKTVTTPGTAVALRASLTCKWVCVTALTSNTGQVNVGGAGVLATSGASTGSPLAAGQSITIPIDDAAKVFIDARVAGEGVSFTVGA